MATKSKAKGGFLEIVKTIVYALLLAGVIRTLFFQPFWIPSGSMKPTLLIGDFLFVNKMAYGYSRYSCPFAWICPFDGRILAHDPKRGDVVVFRHPTNGTDYIKRLIGLPGDTVQMIDGILYINGEVLPQQADGTFTETNAPQGPMGSMPRCMNHPAPGEECTAEQAIETLPGGKTHAVLDIENGFGDTTPVFTVPADEFFFMGDNRDNSMDSRFPRSAGGVGFVPFENLIGRADRVIFSSGGASMLAFWTWRPDRFFKAIQ
jgi:signal peptidase I